MLYRELAGAIRIDRFLWRVLLDRHLLRHAIRRGRAGKDEPRDAMPAQAFHQIERVDEVVLIVFGRIAYRFADIGERREVNDGVDAFFREHLIDAMRLVEIADDQPLRWHGLAMAVDE